MRKKVDLFPCFVLLGIAAFYSFILISGHGIEFGQGDCYGCYYERDGLHSHYVSFDGAFIGPRFSHADWKPYCIEEHKAWTPMFVISLLLTIGAFVFLVLKKYTTAIATIAINCILLFMLWFMINEVCSNNIPTSRDHATYYFMLSPQLVGNFISLILLYKIRKQVSSNVELSDAVNKQPNNIQILNQEQTDATQEKQSAVETKDEAKAIEHSPKEEIKEEKNVANSDFKTRTEQLKQLKELLDNGVLTQEEFDTEKKKILNL